MLLAQMVARSASRLLKLCTGVSSSVCLRAALASADGDGEDVLVMLVTGVVFGEAVLMRRSPGRR